MLQWGRNVVDLSDTGTGKTYQNTAVLAALKKPTLIVVPKIAVTGWKMVGDIFGESSTVMSYELLRTGRTGAGWWDNTPPAGFRSETFFKCTNCQLVCDLDNHQPCYTHPLGIHCVEEKKIPWKYGKFHYHPGVKLIVFDEAHRCSGDSLNADMLIGAVDQGIQVVGVSATLAGSPLDLRAWGYALGLHKLKNFLGWTARYGCGRIDGMKGWHWRHGKEKQREDMKKINSLILPTNGVRVKISEIPGFPERTVTSELYDIEGVSEINELCKQLRDARINLEARKGADKDPELGLTKSLRARQGLELRKVPLMIELARDGVSKGRSMAIFIQFSETMRLLREALKCNCFIDGSNAGAKRDKCIADFQSDSERIILVNGEAGGLNVSLHDLHGEHPREGLIGGVFSARTFIQILGRLQREGGKTPCFYKVLLAAGTDEVFTHRKLQQKLGNIEALNDADFLPSPE